MYRSAVLRQMEIIGEAATHLSDTFKSTHQAIPWRGITGLRIQVAHRYWDIEWSIVEQTILEDLPILRDAFTLPDESGDERQIGADIPTLE